MDCHRAVTVPDLKAAPQPHVRPVRRDPSAKRSCDKVTLAKQDFGLLHAVSAALAEGANYRGQNPPNYYPNQKAFQQNTKTKFK